MADEPNVNSQGAELEDRNAGAPNVPAQPVDRKPSGGDNEEHGTLLNDKSPKPKPEGKQDDPKPDDQNVDPNAEEEEDKPEDTTDWKNQYVEFEDAAGQSVVELLKEANVKPIEANAIFEEAAKTGDLTKVRWDLLEAKLGKAKTVLAKAGIEQHYNQVWKVVSETRDFAFKEVGGEANWKKISSWVQKTEKADPGRKAEFDNLRKAIDLGGPSAQFAVRSFKAAYEGASGNSGLRPVADVQRGDRSGNPVGAPLTRADSLKELHAAHNRNASQAEISAIRARRAAGRQQGI